MRQPTKSAGAVEGGAVNEVRLRQEAIGIKLRQMFDDVVNEAVPEEFLDILRRADSGETAGD